MTTPTVDPAMLPAASYTPACIGDVYREGRIEQCGDPAAYDARTSTPEGIRKDGPVCELHAKRLRRGALDRWGNPVALESLTALDRTGVTA